MALELVYTSAERGLRAGTSGFCTVAMTKGMPPALVPRLEALGGYRPGPSGDGPEAFCFWRVETATGIAHVLSIVGPAPPDHTARTNKIASYLVLSSSELAAVGPAAMLARPGLLRRSWSGAPAWIDEPIRVSVDGDPSPRACSAWKAACGDAGWAGVLASAFLRDQSKPIHVIYRAGLDPLPLVDEAIRLLPDWVRWRATFSTYFLQPVAGTPCAWRFCLEGTAAADSARQSKGLVIDLTRPLEPAPDSRFTRMARTGVGEEGAGPRSKPGSRESRRPHRPDGDPIELALDLEPPAPATVAMPSGRRPSPAPSPEPSGDGPAVSPTVIALIAAFLTLVILGVILIIALTAGGGGGAAGTPPAERTEGSIGESPRASVAATPADSVPTSAPDPPLPPRGFGDSGDESVRTATPPDPAPEDLAETAHPNGTGTPSAESAVSSLIPSPQPQEPTAPTGLAHPESARMIPSVFLEISRESGPSIVLRGRSARIPAETRAVRVVPGRTLPPAGIDSREGSEILLADPAVRAKFSVESGQIVVAGVASGPAPIGRSGASGGSNADTSGDAVVIERALRHCRIDLLDDRGSVLASAQFGRPRSERIVVDAPRRVELSEIGSGDIEVTITAPDGGSQPSRMVHDRGSQRFSIGTFAELSVRRDIKEGAALISASRAAPASRSHIARVATDLHEASALKTACDALKAAASGAERGRDFGASVSLVLRATTGDERSALGIPDESATITERTLLARMVEIVEPRTRARIDSLSAELSTARARGKDARQRGWRVRVADEDGLLLLDSEVIPGKAGRQ
jgi:hypothetical protein